MVPRIRSLNTISDLGIDSNSELLDYVERKNKEIFIFNNKSI